MTDKQDDKDWAKIAEAELSEEPVDTTAESDDTKAAAGDELGGVLEHPSYKKLENQLTETEQQVHEYRDKTLRLASELENSKRRQEKELADAHKFSVEKMSKELLPVIDSLEAALSNSEQTDESLRQGVEMTLKLFIDALAKINIVQIDPIGTAFDPQFHEAMSMQEDPDAEPGHVLMVFQKGYLLHDRVIRPARVIVNKGQATKNVDEQA